MSVIDEVLKDWDELSNEYKNLEVSHKTHLKFRRIFIALKIALQNVNKNYLELLDGLEELQSKCMKDINHQRYRVSQITKTAK